MSSQLTLAYSRAGPAPTGEDDSLGEKAPETDSLFFTRTGRAVGRSEKAGGVFAEPAAEPYAHDVLAIGQHVPVHVDGDLFAAGRAVPGPERDVPAGRPVRHRHVAHVKVTGV